MECEISQGTRIKGSTGSELDFEAAMTKEDLHEGELNNEGVEQYRRITLALLTRSRIELVEGFKNNPDLLIDTIDIVSSYIDYTKTLLSLAESAHARLCSVGMAIEELSV